MAYKIKPGKMKLSELRNIYRGKNQISLEDTAWKDIKASRKVVDKIIEEGRTVYGINTGFGLLAQTMIPKDQLALLQKNLVLSHSTGVGKILDEDTVRLIYALKISSLAQGHSGIRTSTIEAFIDFANAGIIAAIPEKGSVGASGDLAPLAHMTAALMGVGSAIYKGEKMSAQQALDKAGLKAVKLSSKEGLAFLMKFVCFVLLLKCVFCFVFFVY